MSELKRVQVAWFQDPLTGIVIEVKVNAVCTVEFLDVSKFVPPRVSRKDMTPWIRISHVETGLQEHES